MAQQAKIERGEFCPKCKNYIPLFTSLSAGEIQKLRELSPGAAMRKIRQDTGCDDVTAKIWVVHRDGPHAARVRPPCPYCGVPLFSEKTQQCIKCGWDWHDAMNPVRHATEPPDRSVCEENKNARWERLRQRRSQQNQQQQ